METLAVLIVEDNPVYRESLCRMLQAEQGIAVVGAVRSGREAIEEIPRLRPDVVLLDIDLPGQAGLLAARTIRERWPSVKLIVLTLYPGEAFRTWAEQMGAAALLAKEADPETMVHAIRAVGSRP